MAQRSFPAGATEKSGSGTPVSGKASTAMFSAVDALLFRPFPVHQPDRLVDIYTKSTDGDTYATYESADGERCTSAHVLMADAAARRPVLAPRPKGITVAGMSAPHLR